MDDSMVGKQIRPEKQESLFHSATQPGMAHRCVYHGVTFYWFTRTRHTFYLERRLDESRMTEWRRSDGSTVGFPVGHSVFRNLPHRVPDRWMQLASREMDHRHPCHGGLSLRCRVRPLEMPHAIRHQSSGATCEEQRELHPTLTLRP